MEHHEKEFSIVKVALNLFFACIISGVIIGIVFFLSNPYAIISAERMETEAMQSLVPEASSFVDVPGKEGWKIAESGAEKLAYIIPVEPKGFAGAIHMLVAVSKDGAVLNYAITIHKETPGLGDGAEKPKFKDQFIGKTAESLEVTKNPNDKDKIQAMTGATITSRAVTKGIKEAVELAVAEGGL